MFLKRPTHTARDLKDFQEIKLRRISITCISACFTKALLNMLGTEITPNVISSKSL